MYSIRKSIPFEAGHRLMNYEGKCANLHGHNYVLHIGLKSKKLDDNGFVEDFGDIKKIAKSFIDENLDHATILHEEDFETIDFLMATGQKVFTISANPTAEALCNLFYYELKDKVETKTVKLDYIEIEETPTSIARYEE